MLSERVSDGDERDRLMELGFEGDRKKNEIKEKKNHLRSHSTLVGRERMCPPLTLGQGWCCLSQLWGLEDGVSGGVLPR